MKQTIVATVRGGIIQDIADVPEDVQMVSRDMA